MIQIDIELLVKINYIMSQTTLKYPPKNNQAYVTQQASFYVLVMSLP